MGIRTTLFAIFLVIIVYWRKARINRVLNNETAIDQVKSMFVNTRGIFKNTIQFYKSVPGRIRNFKNRRKTDD